nr:hypothetical protein [uncultured Cellulosilyticum sp.]
MKEEIGKTLVERIQLICAERDTNFAEIERSADLKTNTIRRWKDSLPNIANAAKVAKTLRVSLDWLCGLSDYRNSIEESKNINPKVSELADKIKNFDKDKLELLDKYIDLINK